MVLKKYTINAVVILKGYFNFEKMKDSNFTILLIYAKNPHVCYRYIFIGRELSRGVINVLRIIDNNKIMVKK